MKKEYIKPEMVVEEFVSEVYIASASKMPFNPDEEVEGGDANDRRGTWGNLWD